MIERTALLLLLTLQLAACERYRIEYRERPSFYEEATGKPAVDRLVREDGTVVIYRSREARGDLQKTSEDRGDPFMIREETEDGRVILRALLPEHVLVNTMTCIRHQEYQLIWDQLLAEETRQAYALEGLGSATFIEFFTRYRYDLAKTVNRMLHGMPRNEVMIVNDGPGVIRLQFHPLVASQFKFKAVLMKSDQGGLKLLRIE